MNSCGVLFSDNSIPSCQLQIILSIQNFQPYMYKLYYQDHIFVFRMI